MNIIYMNMAKLFPHFIVAHNHILVQKLDVQCPQILFIYINEVSKILFDPF